MAADGEDGKRRRFRLLNAARYLVASVVTVLIIAVIVNAIKMLVRPESLTFYVQRGSVFVRRIKQPTPMLLFDLSVMADNRNGRARIYYYNFTAYLFDKSTPATSLHPEEDSLVYFGLLDDSVRPQGRVESNVQVNETRDVTIAASVFDMLYNRRDATIDGVTMRLEGSVVTEIRSDYNTTPHWTTYYCGPLVLGGNPDDEASQNIPDTLCTETQRT